MRRIGSPDCLTIMPNIWTGLPPLESMAIYVLIYQPIIKSELSTQKERHNHLVLPLLANIQSSSLKLCQTATLIKNSKNKRVF
jgi:hypothetical protein